jgi:hypothetical protein
MSDPRLPIAALRRPIGAGIGAGRLAALSFPRRPLPRPRPAWPRPSPPQGGAVRPPHRRAAGVEIYAHKSKGYDIYLLSTRWIRIAIQLRPALGNPALSGECRSNRPLPASGRGGKFREPKFPGRGRPRKQESSLIPAPMPRPLDFARGRLREGHEFWPRRQSGAVYQKGRRSGPSPRRGGAGNFAVAAKFPGRGRPRKQKSGCC